MSTIPLTVGALRAALADLPDDTTIGLGDAPRPHGGLVNVAILWIDCDGELVFDPSVVEPDVKILWRAEEARHG
jgi:hypothetical protein